MISRSAWPCSAILPATRSMNRCSSSGSPPPDTLTRLAPIDPTYAAVASGSVATRRAASLGSSGGAAKLQWWQPTLHCSVGQAYTVDACLGRSTLSGSTRSTIALRRDVMATGLRLIAHLVWGAAPPGEPQPDSAHSTGANP